MFCIFANYVKRDIKYSVQGGVIKMRPLKKINIIETKEEEHITTTENKRKKIVYICKKEYMRENTARDIIEKLKQAEKEIDRGEGISSDEAFKELRQEFGY